VDRLERLVNLLVALLDTPRPLSREELRERVGGYNADEANFRRNFERDKERLREIGIPVVTEPMDPRLPDGPVGYRVPRDLYELPDPGLDEREMAALTLATSNVAFEGSGQGAVAMALLKLAAANPVPTAAEVSGEDVPASARPRALAPERGAPGSDGVEGGEAGRAREAGKAARHAHPQDGRGALAPLVDMPVGPDLASFFSAVTQRRPVQFVYHGVARRVDPYRLSFREGKWYLSGFDYSRGGERVFRADRVTGPVEVGAAAAKFDRPEGRLSGPPPPWRLGDDEELLVELRVDAAQAGWARHAVGEEAAAVDEPDGSVRLKVPVTNRRAFRTFVLGLLEHAEVLGPPEVREEIAQWLRDIAAGGGASATRGSN